MTHEMSTKNRGSILPAERAERAWPPGRGGLKGRNAFQEPEDIVFGDNGHVGGNCALNTNDLDGDFQTGPWGNDGECRGPDEQGDWI
jgi:hypothetical protein